MANSVGHESGVTEGFTYGHIMVIGHSSQKVKFSDSKGKKKKLLSYTTHIGNSSVLCDRLTKNLGIQTVLNEISENGEISYKEIHQCLKVGI